MKWAWAPTRLGTFQLVAEQGRLVACHLPGRQPPPAGMQDPHDSVLSEAAAQLVEWSQGRRRTFDVPLAPHGTPFQLRVWDALRHIPHGETRTYAQIAAAIGKPGAARAVGQANNRNPLAPFIPCHRVLAADGMGGYAGGLALKRAMLALEREPLGMLPQA